MIVGDHGELFGEHGQFQHGASLYEEALRVPILLLGPDTGPPGEPIPGLRSLVDVAPTVLDWVGVQREGGASGLRHGRSLLLPRGPSKPSSLVRFLTVSQYLLEPASSVWVLECGVLTSREA